MVSYAVNIKVVFSGLLFGGSGYFVLVEEDTCHLRSLTRITDLVTTLMIELEHLIMEQHIINIYSK